MITVREYLPSDLREMMYIWNEIVRQGEAFPQENELDLDGAAAFFGSQSFSGVAVNDSGEVVGLYILHPNNIGRCGHIANASYGVRNDCRGQHIGEALVTHCLEMCKKLSFGILQFNAVVASNDAALKLYKKLGFKQLGIIPNGFRNKNDSYQDIIPHYIEIK